MESSEAFLTLQPYCVAVCKERSADTVDGLNKAIDDLPDVAVQSLQEYVLFPLRLMLKIAGSENEKINNDKVTESVINCISTILKKTILTSLETLVELYTSLCVKISHPKNNGRVFASLSEELKESTTKALNLLVFKSSETLLQHLSSLKFLPALGHSVAVLLSMAENEVCNSLVISSLQAILSLQKHPPMAENGACFATFLPGITIVMLRIATRDTKQNHKITCTAIEVLSSTVALVLDKDSLENQDSIHEGLLKSEVVPEKVSTLLINRSEDWQKTTWAKLEVIANKMRQVASHPHWKTRFEILKLVETIVTKCQWKHFEKHLHPFLEIVVSLLSDENEQVKSKGQIVLGHLQHGGGLPLKEVAAELLRDSALQLPQIFRSSNDCDKLRQVNALNGYLMVLGDQLHMALLSASLLKKLTLALIQILEMDVTDLRIIQRLPSDTLNTTAFDSQFLKPRLQFHFFSDETILKKLSDCLFLFGKLLQSDLNPICDQLFEFLQEKTYAKQVIFMLNKILAGAGCDILDENLETFVTETVIPTYLSSHLLHAAVCENSSPNIAPPTNPLYLLESGNQSQISTVFKAIPDLNSNIILISLTLEGIATCASVMNLKFRPLLIKTLYPVIEKVASDVTMVQDSAYLALGTMATSCGYSTIKDLLIDNADYIINQLRIELRHGFLFSSRNAVKRTSHSPQVLEAILKNGGSDLLPILKDTIDEILDCLDMGTDPDNSKIFLKVLAALVFFFKTWFASEERKPSKKEEVEEDLATFFEEYLNDMKIVDELDVDATNEDDDYHEEPTAPEPELPFFVGVSEQVMMRCVYHMPDENPHLRMLVLDVIQNCCLVLRNHENTLLPLAHKLWCSFVHRLNDRDHFVIKKSYETMVVLSQTCGDFLLQRFSKDVLPALTKFMTTQGDASAKLKESNSYHFTVAYKLQLSILNGIGSLCRSIGFRVETGLDSIVTFCLNHMMLSQPEELQDAAKAALIDLGAVDPDLIWLRVSLLRGDLNIDSHTDKAYSHVMLSEIIQAV